MGDRVVRSFRDSFHNSGNRNAIRDHGYYDKTVFLSSSSDGNDLGRSVSIMDALYHEDGFPQEEDESPKKEKASFQNVDHLDRKDYDDGDELDKPTINGEFNDCSGKKEDCAIHVRGIGSEWRTNVYNTESQRVNSMFESGNSTSHQMVQNECSERIQKLNLPLGSLRRVDTFGSTSWTKEVPKTPCHIVLPYSQFETTNCRETNPSMPQVSIGDEIDETHGRCRSPLMVVDMITKSNRNHIAASLGLEVQNEDQDDEIGYIKEDLACYIEEVDSYGFDHIIVIGERYLGLLFMDCFCRVFDWDSMGNVLWLLGDYSKRVESVTKGLKTGRGTPWIAVSDGSVIETKEYSPYDHYTFPDEKINKKTRSKKKSSRKKSSKKKYH